MPATTTNPHCSAGLPAATPRAKSYSVSELRGTRIQRAPGLSSCGKADRQGVSEESPLQSAKSVCRSALYRGHGLSQLENTEQNPTVVCAHASVYDICLGVSPQGTCVEVRGELSGVSSFHPDWTLVVRLVWQASFENKPSGHPNS